MCCLLSDYAELTSGQFIKKDITGGHFYFFEEENFETIKNCIVSNLLETKAKCGWFKNKANVV